MKRLEAELRVLEGLVEDLLVMADGRLAFFDFGMVGRITPELQAKMIDAFFHVVGKDPAGIAQDELELEMIDHGLEEMGESTGDKGEPQLLLRCAFADFGRLQKGLEDRGIKPISAESEYIPTTPVELPEDRAAEVAKLVDALEQDEDVQKVFHNMA